MLLDLVIRTKLEDIKTDSIYFKCIVKYKKFFKNTIVYMIAENNKKSILENIEDAEIQLSNWITQTCDLELIKIERFLKE